MKTALAPLFLFAFATAALAQGNEPWWPAEVEKALARAGDNRAELVKALEAVPKDQRNGMSFLIAHMPQRDLRSLSAEFLLENIDLAYKVRKQLPWGKQVPEEIFLNDVLAYANLDEARHPWRKQLYELCLPMVKDCATPGEAAQKLNATIFKELKVRYSTGRKKAQQSPKESIEQGLATCSGLSILLVDACRSVGVPARVVGTPMWANERGNHTWVEVWDKGWHFTGAAEYDAKGLDRAWFVGDAAQAKAEAPKYSIYAASFKKTGITFPLVWAPDSKEVNAENVTARYAKPKSDNKLARVQVRVWKAGKKERLAAPVTVRSKADASRVFDGESRGETTDTNDFLTFELPAGDYLLRLGTPEPVEIAFKAAAGEKKLLEIEASPGLSDEQTKQVEKAAAEFFAADEAKRAKWEFGAALDKLLAKREGAVRQAVWKAYRAAPIHAAAKEDFDAKRVKHGKHLSAYTVKTVGKRPAGGWPLFIAMHGGGGAPKEVNDSQWKHMQIYYRDQPAVTGYLYVALRAPNDTWNGFYDDYVPPLVVNLIRQFTLFGDVDPDRVFLMGYSHGGYGAFFIGPKIPDRFAAIHASAAAPTDGTISPKSLRNTRFTFMIGENDTAYGRRERCEKFDAAIRKLKEADKDGYPVALEFMKGFGHGGLPDRDKIKDLYPHTRNPVPLRLCWEPTDKLIRHHFWLTVPEPARGQSVDVTIKGNSVEAVTTKVAHFDLCLDGRLVSFAEPLLVTVDGKARKMETRPRFATLCETLLERGDPSLACTCRVRLEAEKK